MTNDKELEILVRDSSTSDFDNHLTSAIIIATFAHAKELNKYSGEPYIDHPIRVMRTFMGQPSLNDVEYNENIILSIVAVLHDVLEDTGEIGSNLLSNSKIPKPILNLLPFITRVQGEKYEDFIDKTMLTTYTKRVKIADVIDNLSRTETLTPSLKRRYKRGMKKLLA